MKNWIYLFSLLALLAISCDENKKADAVAVIPDIIVKEVLSTSQDCVPDSLSCTYVRIEYPVFTDSSKSQLNEVISTQLKSISANFIRIDATNNTFEHMAQSFIQDFEAFRLDFPTYQLGWHVNMKAEIIYESEHIVSFRIDAESFTGGAHPNSSTNYFVLDSKTNRILKTADIIGDTTKFKQLLETAFRQSKGMEENQSYADLGFFISDDEFLLSDNIGITENEVVVHFNSYEIAPYSEGATTIELKKETLGELLKVK